MPFHRSLFTLLTTLHLAVARIIAIHATDDGFSIVNGGSEAVVGDLLEFHFLTANHSVVRGDPAAPCHPVASGGFFSGFLPTTLGENPNVFHVLLNDTNPLFFYCAQTTPTNACASGMVGAINAPASALEKYKCDAAGATTAVVPAQTPYGGVVVPLNGGYTATSTVSGNPTATATGGIGGAGTETCTTGTGGMGGTATVPGSGVTVGTSSTSVYVPGGGVGGGVGGTATTGGTAVATGTGTGTGTGTETGTGTGSETPGAGAGDPAATTGSEVPTTNGAGRVGVWSGLGVVVGAVMVFGWML